jgi:NADPH2:quinone reductase
MAISIPQKQKGVIVNKPGGVDVLEYRDDLDVPVPKEGEILVKNEFVGLNYIDT